MDVAPERREASAPHRDGAMPANGEPGPEEIWTEPIDRLLTRLATTGAGLTAAEVQSRLTRYGPNTAAAVKRSPLWLQFLARFRSPLVIILLVASGLSAATGDVASFVVVVTIVTISITLDFVQEVRAQNALRRDGASLSVPIDQLVPGDIVELIAGDLIPADSRLLETVNAVAHESHNVPEPLQRQQDPKQCSGAARRGCRHLG